MRTPVDATLRREASEFRLRFTCEHCAHFEATREVCAEGYPNEPHRAVPLPEVPSLVFCKSFELG